MTTERVLVTGGTGFVGQRLVRRLIAGGHSVRLLTRRPVADSRVEVRYIANVDDEEALRQAMSGVGMVCHLAARAHIIGKLPADHEIQFEKINVEMSCRLARAAFSSGVRRFVFVSSIGAVSTFSVPGQPLNEQMQCHPTTLYGQSKLRAESMLRSIADQCRAELVIVRPPLVHGKNAPGNLARMARWIMAGVPLPLGSVVNQRSLIHVDNLAHVLQLCLEHPRAAGQIFHVRDLRDYSTPELLAGVAYSLERPLRLMRFPLPILEVLARVAGQDEAFRQLAGWLQLDDSHVRATLDFMPLQLPFEAV